MATESQGFPVFEYSGTPRSGKGSIVGHISSIYEGVAVEEAGADYRVLTRSLLETSVLEAGLPIEEVAKRVERLGIASLTGILAEKAAILEEFGHDSLYMWDVADLVGMVAPNPDVQAAVNTGFGQRVEGVIQSGESQILLVDHRNSVPIIRAIPAARLVMRTFVSCMPIEAAWRECARQGIVLGGEDFMNVYHGIVERSELDANRKIDPVVPDEYAIDYWYDQTIFDMTTRRIADLLYEGDYWRAVKESFSEFREFTDVIRHGAGAKAIQTGRQIKFDTTPFREFVLDPKADMLRAARIMFDEALEEIEVSL